MTLPRVGDVYETSVRSMGLLLCVRVREISLLGGHSYDFLVLDGGPPAIRTWTSRRNDSYPWSSGHFSDFSLEATMGSFQFKKIA